MLGSSLRASLQVPSTNDRRPCLVHTQTFQGSTARGVRGTMSMTNVLQGASKVKASIGTSKEVRRAFDSDLETCWSYDLVCARETG